MRNLYIQPLLIVLIIFAGCDVGEMDFTPLQMDDGWKISTPEEQGVDREEIQRMYNKAEGYENIYSILVIKNGHLIAEGYFNGVQATDANPMASATKSYTSTLAGIALREKIIPSIEAKMAPYFPEIDWQTQDPRKSEINIQQMLQMRSGYPWEHRDGFSDQLWPRAGNLIPFLAEFPLMADPGNRYGYSNLTSHMLAIIIARAYGDTLLAFANQYLFNPLGVSISHWPSDDNGYYIGYGNMEVIPRDMAKFGLLYLNKGMYNGQQLIPALYINDSLTPYSFDVFGYDILTHIKNLHYGYQWWCGTSGSHTYNFAWGHGGNLIVILHDLNMVVVATADSLPGQFGEAAAIKEKRILNLVGEFIGRL